MDAITRDSLDTLTEFTARVGAFCEESMQYCKLLETKNTRATFLLLRDRPCCVCTRPGNEAEVAELIGLFVMQCGSCVPHYICYECYRQLPIPEGKTGRSCPVCRQSFTAISEYAPELFVPYNRHDKMMEFYSHNAKLLDLVRTVPAEYPFFANTAAVAACLTMLDQIDGRPKQDSNTVLQEMLAIMNFERAKSADSPFLYAHREGLSQNLLAQYYSETNGFVMNKNN